MPWPKPGSPDAGISPTALARLVVVPPKKRSPVNQVMAALSAATGSTVKL